MFRGIVHALLPASQTWRPERDEPGPANLHKSTASHRYIHNIDSLASLHREPMHASCVGAHQHYHDPIMFQEIANFSCGSILDTVAVLCW